MIATDTAVTLARVAAQAAADKLAKDILLVDVSERLAITDVFVIVTGANERQVGAIVDAVEEKMRAAGTRPPRREGERDGRWVLLDFIDVVVHVQHAEERVFYALDRLWKDCPTIPFTDAALGESATGASSGQPPESPGPESPGPESTRPESTRPESAGPEFPNPAAEQANGPDGHADGTEQTQGRPGVVAAP